MKTVRIFTLAAILASMAFAPAASANLSMMNFNLNIYGALQKAGGNTFSGQLSWNPTLHFGNLYVRGNAGATYLKSTFDSKFFAVNGQAFVGLSQMLGSIGAEAGGGLQSWLNNGGTHPIVSGNVLMGVNRWFGVVDRIFVGYSQFLLTGNTTHEVHIGAGIAF